MGFRVQADKQIDNPSPYNNHKKNSALKLGTWNVRTKTPGFSDNLHEIDDVRKTAVIDMELSTETAMSMLAQACCDNG